MKLERIGEWVRWQNGWHKPMSIFFENHPCGEGDFQVRVVFKRGRDLVAYFHTEPEAVEFAREIMGGADVTK